ncbi:MULTISPECIES: LCP family protein [unclassified Pseudoclavibacter]|uniref:LCP family protein n=1 Tax=unclassified Pseudoclavibacter TaxID=2615177 RepID=UPI000CE8D882|nr:MULTISPECIES: LCP family protein [unclassified Pseudoclavibacter]MBF4551405.1 LCP family protein [Pseudoclavibacter sp. VKM Ac-2888]PPF72967.1 LytR family transcriptional regulator [Pseudoclavibacter sp. Z016]
MTHPGPSRARRGYVPGKGVQEETPKVTSARHGKQHVTTPTNSVVKTGTIALCVALVSVMFVGALAWINLQSKVTTFDIADPSGSEEPASFAEIEGGINVLLVGSDDRTGQGAEFGEGEADADGVLNDVNMLLHIAEDRSSASVVSIPRDTIVNQPACTNDQGVAMEEAIEVPMNSILGEGGMNCVVSTVEAMSGIEIPYAAMVKFRGVIEMSNAVGGVDVCVANEISDDYVGLYLQPGDYTLQGEDALKFLRTRHGVGDGSDLTRIANQQVFLSALIREVKSAGTLTNPVKLYGLGVAATQNMTMSSSLTDPNTLVSMAMALSQVPLDKITFVQLPTAAYDSARVQPLEPDASAMWELLRTDQSLEVAGAPEPTETPADPSATVSIDPATGWEIDPTTGFPIDPATGIPVDPATGLPVETPPTSAVPQPTLAGQRADEESCSNASSSLF